MRLDRPLAVAARIAAIPIVLAAACQQGQHRESDTTDAKAPVADAAHPLGPAPESSKPFDADLLRIARDYKSWTRVSDEAHWSPFDCMAPRPTGVLPSRSADPSSHGRKLYYLFAKDPQAYRELDVFEALEASEQGEFKQRLIGQVLVKESWTPVEVELGDVPKLEVKHYGDRPIPADFVIDGERAFRAGEQAELFVMYKQDPATPGTDEGWVYGTLSADGARVTSAGRVESCMNCHSTTGRDRLYGHPRMRAEGAKAGQATLRDFYKESR